MPRLTLPPALILPLLACLALAACGPHPDAASRAVGDADHGKTLIQQKACGSCHQIPGIPGANGMVGPPLVHIGKRTVIAGMLPNTPDNMVRWLMDPQKIVPGNAMPNTELNDHDAHDVAAYLYSLR
jgi:cytochrome c1